MFQDGMKKPAPESIRGICLVNVAVPLIRQAHIFVPQRLVSNRDACDHPPPVDCCKLQLTIVCLLDVHEDGARVLQLYSGIASPSEALHIKCRCAISREFGGEIGVDIAPCML